MRTKLVYDLPTRFFHWMFAGLFVTAFSIAKLVDSDSSTFTYHMLAGLTLGFVVLLRIVWGFIGTRHARFNNFALNPKDLFSYSMGLFTKSKKLWAGHNPASSWSAVAMIMLALGLGATGYLMTTSDNKETFEDIHELMANGFIILVGLHILGVLFHMFQHRDALAFSMVDGNKSEISDEEIISSSKPVAGLVLIFLTLTFALHLARSYDATSGQLKVFGATLQLADGQGE